MGGGGGARTAQGTPRHQPPPNTPPAPHTQHRRICRHVAQATLPAPRAARESPSGQATPRGTASKRMRASSTTLDELPDTALRRINLYLGDVAPRALVVSSQLFSRLKCDETRLILSRPLLARIPRTALDVIFLYAGRVAPKNLAFSALTFTRFKAAGHKVRRTRLLLAKSYGGDPCKQPCHVCVLKKVRRENVMRKVAQECARPAGHLGRCVCFDCQSHGEEQWFPGLRLCHLCNAAILGVVAKSAQSQPMHWGCFRYGLPPEHASRILPEARSHVPTSRDRACI